MMFAYISIMSFLISYFLFNQLEGVNRLFASVLYILFVLGLTAIFGMFISCIAVSIIAFIALIYIVCGGD